MRRCWGQRGRIAPPAKHGDRGGGTSHGAANRPMSDDRRSSDHALLGIWHVVVLLAGIYSFYVIDAPRQHDAARRTADLMNTAASDKAQFVEESLKVEPVLETDVLKLMGS